MKKINRNIIVFVLAFLFVAGGLLSPRVVTETGSVVLKFFEDVKTYGLTLSFNEATSNVEGALSKSLTYHNALMDATSVLYRLFGVSVVEKDDTTVVRAKNGYLGNPRGYMTDEDISWRTENVARLMDIAEEKGAGFLYVMAPTKGYSLEYPSNVEDYTASNCNRFVQSLESRNVPYVSLVELSKEEGITDEEMFFATDHHWKPSMGIWASGKVCSALDSNYGFDFDASLWNIKNYDVTVYEDWFLGSQGKKVGRYFTHHGPDDIELIIPKFETSLKEEQPVKGLVRQGSFRDLLYLENISTKDHYHLNPYATYSGGDFREQIITNNLNTHGKTVLVIRDSFGCAFTPFFSLAFSKTYITDVRDGGYVGEKLDMREYIEKINPDYVVVFYTGLSGGDSLYTFVDNK